MSKVEYFSFGQAHTHVVNGKRLHANVMACVEVADDKDPRTELVRVIGPKFCTSYPQEYVEDMANMRWYPEGVVYISQEDIEEELRIRESKTPRDRQEELIGKIYLEAIYKDMGGASTSEAAYFMYENRCRITRDLTPEAMDKILNCGKPMNTMDVMEMVAEYVRGELDL